MPTLRATVMTSVDSVMWARRWGQREGKESGWHPTRHFVCVVTLKFPNSPERRLVSVPILQMGNLRLRVGEPRSHSQQAAKPHCNLALMFWTLNSAGKPLTRAAALASSPVCDRLWILVPF